MICAIRTCGHEADQVAKVSGPAHSTTAYVVLDVEHAVKALEQGFSVPLCNRDRAFVISKIALEAGE